MKTSKRSAARFAICVDNSEYPASLELHKLYRVIPDEDAKKDGDLRIIDESGEDYLRFWGHNTYLILGILGTQYLFVFTANVAVQWNHPSGGTDRDDQDCCTVAFS